MGNIWKYTMPLLSTLAALVIIVHSAEENYEQDYRQIRPRTLDLAASNYDQSWRAIEVEPEVTQPSQINQEENVWGDENIQLMRRRRRKRKRRPNQSHDDVTPQGFLYREASETHQQDTVEMPRRRRKKNDYQDSRGRNRPAHWNGEDLERPLRRKGQRRKRPPVLTEFNRYRPDSSEEIVPDKEFNVDSYGENNRKVEMEANGPIESEIQFDGQTEPQFIDETTQAISMNNPFENESVMDINTKFLSEYSSQVIKSTKNNNISLMPNQKTEKSSINNNVGRSKEKRPLDPFTLKDILKKSNGKSLSEILQQNNLSLTDLLHGKEKAISILQRKDFINDNDFREIKRQSTFVNDKIKFEDQLVQKVESEYQDSQIHNDNRKQKEYIETTTECSTNTEIVTLNNSEDSKSSEIIYTEQTNNLPSVESTTRNYIRRRFPIRRKLRMRPTYNNTYKGQLSRDLITLTSLKYKNSKSLSKSKEWKDILPAMNKMGQAVTVSNIEILSEVVEKSTTTSIPEETTTDKIFETTTDPTDAFINTVTSFYMDNDNTESIDSADLNNMYNNKLNFKTETPLTTTTIEDTKEEKHITVENPKIVSTVKPVVNSSALRRQAYNNRLKRKRVKQKTSTTELPDEKGLKDIYATSNFVSASEFIANTRTTNSEPVDDFSTLEDFITTEATRNTKIEISRSTKTPHRTSKFTGPITTMTPFTTGETAKYEIDEILSDNLASESLSKILKERNMTLKELVEHRERGSSHIHLADIFHNASKEPNPPEPFLSKSLIEPISKGTYPLRALLEANSYDPKTTTIDPNLNVTNNLNIPVVMDFGNNVNENGENMGIISLFNNFSKIDNKKPNQNYEVKKSVEDKSNGYILNNEAVREGRLIKPEKDLMTWNDLINLMQKSHERDVEENTESTEDFTIPRTLKNMDLDKDSDDDNFMVLEDIQKLKDLNSKIMSDELLEFKLYDNVDSTQRPPVKSTILNNNTKSVTVATASIIGLILILFLLTYAILKWKQQNKMFHNKHAKEDECVPTPIFENRKGHKINSSTRSKSPMISSSNIYSIDSIDTHVGNESPEYMWDTLRKPFQ